jgi:hypothetical protein
MPVSDRTRQLKSQIDEMYKSISSLQSEHLKSVADDWGLNPGVIVCKGAEEFRFHCIEYIRVGDDAMPWIKAFRKLKGGQFSSRLRTVYDYKVKQ